MKTRSLLLAAATALVWPQILPAQKSTSDLQPPTRRQATVEVAERLTRPPTPPAVPDDLPHPFNPLGFDGPGSGGPPASGKAPIGGAPTPGVVVQPAGPVGDREILEKLAAQINPSGMVIVRGAPRLMIANKPFEVGTRFGVNYNGQDYELELIAIDRTTFSLRFRKEEITRPIRATR
jgi:hypothetical protein